MAFEMTRGDTFSFTIVLKNPDGTPITLDTTDKLYFTLKSSTLTRTIVTQKILTYDQRAITLNPSDTNSLRYGVYVFDIELRKGNGDILTIVKPTNLNINAEVTWNE